MGIKSSQKSLLSGDLLTKNTILNVLGKSTPLIAGLYAIPNLIEKLGTERFGILTIIWMLIGYFSLFDFGISRALTKFVSSKLGSGRESEIPNIIGTSFCIIIVLGVLSVVVVLAGSNTLVTDLLNVSDKYEKNTVTAVRWIAVALPFVIASSSFVGVLKSYQRFFVISSIQAPLGVFTFLCPLAIAYVDNSLVSVTIALCFGRLLFCICYGFFMVKTASFSIQNLRIDQGYVYDILSFGGWLTVSNVLSPFMEYLDRFLIGGVLSMSSVAYYTTPFDVVRRIWILPTSLMGVIFPALSNTAKSDRNYLKIVFENSVLVLILVLFPVIFCVFLFAPEGLDLWVGPKFSEESAPVARILVLGVFVNSLVRVPFALIQAEGRADITAKVHLLELPTYLLLLWWFVSEWGIIGAAIAWSIRMFADTLILFTVSAILVQKVRQKSYTLVSIILLLLTIIICNFIIDIILYKIASLLITSLLLYVSIFKIYKYRALRLYSILKTRVVVQN